MTDMTLSNKEFVAVSRVLGDFLENEQENIFDNISYDIPKDEIRYRCERFNTILDLVGRHWPRMVDPGRGGEEYQRFTEQDIEDISDSGC